MRAAVVGAFIALSVTAAGAQQQDVASVRAVLPGCKYYVALADGQNPELTVPMGLSSRLLRRGARRIGGIFRARPRHVPRLRHRQNHSHAGLHTLYRGATAENA